MWYISSFKLNPGIAMVPYEDTGTNPDPERTGGGRAHGNGSFDMCSVAWHDSTANKRAENDGYDADYSEDPPRNREFWLNAPSAIERVEGSFYIIDCEDPELVEHGEEYIHERLSSHLSFLYVEPEDSWPVWGRDVRHYMDGLFFNNLARGYADAGAILVEPVRQGLGLPYEWLGAPIV